jgi:PAS domain S-box-containing protein
VKGWRVQTDLLDMGKLLRSIVDREHVAVSLHEPIDAGRDIRYIYTNPAYQALKPGVGMVGRTYREVWPEVADAVLPLVAEVLETGKPWSATDLPLELEPRPGVRETHYFTFEVWRIVDGDRYLIAATATDTTEAKRREDDRRLIAEIAHDLTVLTERKAIIETVGKKLGEYLGAANVLFAVVDDAQGTSAVTSAWSNSEIPDVTGVYPHSEFVTEGFDRAARADETVVIQDTQTDPRTDAAGYGALNIHSFVTAPYGRAGGWRYLFTVNDSKPRRWRTDEVQLVEEVTAHIVPGVERATAEESLREANVELERRVEQRTQRLAESEQRFRTLVTASNDVVYRMSPDWSAMRQLQGRGFLANTEVENPDWLHDYIPESDRELVLSTIAEAIARASVFELEHRVYEADGSVGWTHSRAVPVLDDNGEVVEWFGFASDVTDRMRAEERAKEDLETTRALLDAARALAIWTDLNELLSSLAKTVLDMTAHTRVTISLLESDDQTVSIAASIGVNPVPRLRVPISTLSALAREVIRSGRPLVADQDAEPEAERGIAGEYDVHLALHTPLTFRDRVVGVISIDDPGARRPFTDRERESIDGVASQAALAIDNARLFEAVRENEQRYERLFTSAREGFAHYQGIYDGEGSIADLRVLDINPAGAALSGKSREEQVGRTWLEVFPGLDPKLFSVYQQADQTGEPVRFDDDNGLTHRWYDVTVQPIGRGEFITTFVDITDRKKAEEERARLLETERERARLGQSMVEINNELASSLNIDESLPRVFDRACRELGAYAAGVTDRVEGGWRIRVLAGVQGSGYTPGFTFPDEQAPTLMAILRTGEPDITPDVRLSPNADLVVAERAGYRAYVGYPLTVRGEVVAALGVFFHEPHHLTEIEADYVRRLAFAVSLAEENSRLYKATAGIAETLQTALLALPERIPRIEFAHLYHSASEEARVGGDFYDLFELEHDKIGITVGDISGHGVEAAVLTSLVKNAIRVQATQQDKTPNEVIADASQILYDNSPAEIFATVFFGVLHLDDGLLEFSNAGHTTGACICSDGGVRKLPPNSPLMGAFNKQEFGLSREHLEVHDLLFLYTDGLTEARRDGELFGEDRLFDMLAAERGGYPEHTLRTVVGRVLTFSEGRLSDDLAVLAVERAAPQ